MWAGGEAARRNAAGQARSRAWAWRRRRAGMRSQLAWRRQRRRLRPPEPGAAGASLAAAIGRLPIAEGATVFYQDHATLFFSEERDLSSDPSSNHLFFISPNQTLSSPCEICPGALQSVPDLNIAVSKQGSSFNNTKISRLFWHKTISTALGSQALIHKAKSERYSYMQLTCAGIPSG